MLENGGAVPARPMCAGIDCACRQADGLTRAPNAPANQTAEFNIASNEVHHMLTDRHDSHKATPHTAGVSNMALKISSQHTGCDS